MGLGIIEPKSHHHVPGTSRLYDDRIVHPGVEATISLEPERLKNLKHGTGKEADILLVPQPSNSPNDPLVCFSFPSLDGGGWVWDYAG
jgi:hypothetical protein